MRKSVFRIYEQVRNNHLCTNAETTQSLEIMDNEARESLVLRKSVFGVSDQVPQKPGCTATEDG